MEIPLVQLALDRVTTRLHKKKANAVSAYVKAGTVKCTQNCKHHGAQIADTIHLCKIRATGANEIDASQCWDEKARWCDEFVLRRSVERLRADFQQMSEEELALRWPSINELSWCLRMLQATLKAQEKPDPKTEVT